MTHESCYEALLAHDRRNSASNGVEQVRVIVPTATGTAQSLVAVAISMLGWDHTKLHHTEDAVRRYILTQYPLRGRGPSCQEIEEALRLTGTEVRTILMRLHELDILYLEPGCLEIRLAYPFSSVPTRHVVKFENWAEAKPVYAQCAVDALGIPFMFGHDLSVASSCAHCSTPVTLEVRNRMIVTYNPGETVVWAGATRSGPAATSVCPTINFFCSSESVATWLQGQADATGSMVSLAEAFYIGKAIFEPLLIRHEAKGEGEEEIVVDHSANGDVELFAELRKLSPKVTGGLLRMRQEAYRDAVVAAKYKLLTAMAISIAIRCEPCIRAYVKMAYEKGISQEELIEFLEVAMTMQGCPGEEWALKAYATYKECLSGDQPTTKTACCAH